MVDGSEKRWDLVQAGERKRGPPGASGSYARGVARAMRTLSRDQLIGGISSGAYRTTMAGAECRL
jgi:hypothetical protein